MKKNEEANLRLLICAGRTNNCVLDTPVCRSDERLMQEETSFKQETSFFLESLFEWDSGQGL
ncbi:MAG: hypothetical protein E6X49_22145 [Leclercia adecarboxylata]|nr:hypothetical protein [Leclercia adecarboxylata]